MIYSCNFCKEKDQQETIPSLSVDLAAAIESGVVLDTGVIEEHNNLDDPSCVHTRVKDVFHALELQRAYLDKGRITPGAMAGANEHGGVVTTTSTSSAGAPTQSE